MRVLENLQPQEVFKIFEDICQIPHGSGNMEKISQYCVDFAKAHGLEYIQDDMKNVIIIKEATAGYEDAAPVILQGHLDMVCEKTPDKKINFMTDGLDLCTDGEKIWADGTTLGGDDGIAVAYALAVLASDQLQHPRIEAVLTVDEETGLYGAEAIDLSMLKGRKLINMDSEEEGYLLASCAGGLTQTCEIPVEWEEAAGIVYELKVTGLKGGHSGADIHLGRGNSNVIMGRVLLAAEEKAAVAVMSLAGGTKDNAIPRLTEAKVLVKEADCEAFEGAVAAKEAELKKELHAGDPGIALELQKKEAGTKQVLTENSAGKVLHTLNNIPNGVQAYSMDMEGLVETSLNMGVMKLEEKALVISFAVRSSVESAKFYLSDRVKLFAEMLGGTSVVSGDYPGWAYQPQSELRDTMVRVYERMYGKKPVVQAIHAGLECGMFVGKLENLDCISFGPDMHQVHTSEETLDVASVKRCWEYLCEILKEK
ncbi:MAG: aminoacyl-histidine dipeptidase [Lachnospiraceae bacterium]